MDQPDAVETRTQRPTPGFIWLVLASTILFLAAGVLLPVYGGEASATALAGSLAGVGLGLSMARKQPQVTIPLLELRDDCLYLRSRSHPLIGFGSSFRKAHAVHLDAVSAIRLARVRFGTLGRLAGGERWIRVRLETPGRRAPAWFRYAEVDRVEPFLRRLAHTLDIPFVREGWIPPHRVLLERFTR